MKTQLAFAACLALASAAAVAERKTSYDGYKVFRLAVGNETETINDIVSRLSLKTWKGAPRAGAAADIVVPPSRVEEFRTAITGFDFEMMHEDLGKSMAHESNFHDYAVGSANSTWFNSYHSYADHLQFWSDLQAQYPSNSEIVTSGKSLNGLPITGLHFWGKDGKGAKPAVVLHGTVHAREWVSTMVVEYMAYNLLTNYAGSSEVGGFIDKYDFYIFPVVNPDGFLYTQTNDRLWRKNRQTTSGSTCLGRDINRNWPYKWSTPGGASTNPCAEDFKGGAEGDSPEAEALALWLKDIKKKQGLKLFIDYHAYSQLFMTPYGYTCDTVPANNPEYQSLAKGAVAAIKAVHGIQFKYGPICSTIYKATGASVDYVSDIIGSDYTFTSELRDRGLSGFILPPSQILPSGEESYAGLRYLLLNMK